MARVKNPVANALANALTNERYGRGGVVSAKDAKQIVGSALSEIGKSEKPLDTFKDNQRFVEAAKDLLGRSRDAARTLESYSDEGMNAVHARLEALSGEVLLPAAAQAEFDDYLDWPLNLDPNNVEISDVRGSVEEGYAFKYVGEGVSGTAHMLKVGGEWLVSPVEIDQQMVAKTMDHARAYLDDVVVPMLNDWGDELGAEEIRAMLDGLQPGHVVPGDDDPDKTDECWEEGWPYEMNIRGDIGCDGGVYVSFNPAEGTFNAFGRYA